MQYSLYNEIMKNEELMGFLGEVYTKILSSEA
jgi:hypothetical protein